MSITLEPVTGATVTIEVPAELRGEVQEAIRGITAASPALIQAVYRAWKALRDVDRLGETIAEQARAASGDDLGDATNVEDVVGAMVRSMADAVALHDIATSILRHLLEAVESRTWPEYLGVAAEIHATA